MSKVTTCGGCVWFDGTCQLGVYPESMVMPGTPACNEAVSSYERAVISCPNCGSTVALTCYAGEFPDDAGGHCSCGYECALLPDKFMDNWDGKGFTTLTQKVINNNPAFFNFNISGNNNSFYNHVDTVNINNGGQKEEW